MRPPPGITLDVYMLRELREGLDHFVAVGEQLAKVVGVAAIIAGVLVVGYEFWRRDR